MTYLRKDVPRANTVSPGAGRPKMGEITAVYADDIHIFPERDAGGVQMVGNAVLKPNAKMYRIYMTPTSQKASHTTEGDEDMEGFKKKYEGFIPGDTLEANEFIQDGLGKGFVLFYGVNCGSMSNKVVGTPCNPMKFKDEFEDGKDGVRHNLTFEQYMADGYVAGFYNGTLQYASNFEVAAVTQIDLTPANGTVYQLPATAVEAAVDVDTLTLPHGSIVSLIGGGGAGPSKLESGAKTGATVILAQDSDWMALKGSVINFKVVDAGPTKYLVEESRK